MEKQPGFQEIDYLIMGHLTVDITPEGKRLGGTAAYAALLASRLGLNVGLVTAWPGKLPPELTGKIQIRQVPAEHATTFQTLYRTGSRQLIILQKGPGLEYKHIPSPWRTARMIHLGPIAGELDRGLPYRFPNSRLGITAQGWLRDWELDGRITPLPCRKVCGIFSPADVVVISEEDVSDLESEISHLAAACGRLIVTRGYRGARIYTRGDVQEIPAPTVDELDPTGAGDIFAAGFFAHYFQNNDFLQAARFATELAVISVTREGLAGVPDEDEIRKIQEGF